MEISYGPQRHDSCRIAARECKNQVKWRACTHEAAESYSCQSREYGNRTPVCVLRCVCTHGKLLKTCFTVVATASYLARATPASTLTSTTTSTSTPAAMMSQSVSSRYVSWTVSGMCPGLYLVCVTDCIQYVSWGLFHKTFLNLFLSFCLS